MADSQAWGLVSVRVTSPHPGESTAYARQHPLTLGRATTFDRLDPRLSAMEALCGAVAGDLIDTFRRVARERRLEVDEIEATVEAEMENPLVHLGVVGETGSPALGRLQVKAYASSFDPAETVLQAWQDALPRAPVWTTLCRAVPDATAVLKIAH